MVFARFLVHLENVVILFTSKTGFLVRKRLYLDKMYIGGITFILCHLTPGSTPGVGPEVII